MTMFENIENGALVNEWGLKELFPHTLFPAVITDVHAAQVGYRVVPEQPFAPQQLDPLTARRAAYATESDHLKVEAEYDALLSGTDPDYAAWIAAVTAIKERYPLETSSDE
ncbi:hypothetical protein [Aquipseudomonas campi]